MSDFFNLASPSSNRDPLTPEQQASVDDVLDAAAAWAAGHLPFYEAAAIGTIEDANGTPSPAYTRYVATIRTLSDDPRRKNLMDLLDVLIEAQGYVMTRQGVYTKFEIRDNEAGWQYANLNERGAA